MGDNMKIILSRKGFDSSTGGFPSPIIVENGSVEDGILLSLPIPVTEKQEKKKEKGISYNKLRYKGKSLGTIVQQFTHRQFKQAHLDPDLDKDRYERKKGWKPVFGQTGAAQTYLKNRGVGESDLFLFFGWFKKATYNNNGELKYVPRAKDLHVIFVWLKVSDKSIDVDKDQPLDKFESWLHYHPHIVNREIYTKNNNKIYIATRNLTLDGLSDKDGGGIFPNFKSSLQLTAPKEDARSHWCLPKWLLEGAWQCSKNDHLPFSSGGRRQEFVFDVPEQNKKKAITWLRNLFEDC
jgi:hypothetical protein